MKIFKAITRLFKSKKTASKPTPSKAVEQKTQQQPAQERTQQKPKQQNSRPQQKKQHNNQGQQSQKKEQPRSQQNRQNKPKGPKPEAKKTEVQTPKVPVKLKEIILPEIKEVPEVEGKSRFTELDVRREILAATQDMGFEYMTPIQDQSLPRSLEGHDIAGKAQTGTGKTASFLIAAINHMLENPIEGHRRPGSCRVIILAPTRELAIQIHKDADALCKYTHFNNLAIFGGMGHASQKERLRKPIDILVATPGRCIDYMRSNSLDLSLAEVLIIDEADRMLDMGFVPDVRKIVQKTPHPGKRHTMMFSATLTESVLRLIKSWQKNPITIEIEAEALVTELIEQRFYSVMSRDKLAALLWILKNEEVNRMLIFINRKDQATKLVANLRKYGVTAAEMTGDVPQAKRMRLLEDLRTGKVQIVVATDVAARGIHVDDISHVINYDLPVKAEDYVHRIGRTGRAGNKGNAYSFICESGAYVLEDLEKVLEEEIKSIYPEDEMLELPKL